MLLFQGCFLWIRSSEAVLSEVWRLMEVFLTSDAFSSHYETCGCPNMNTMQSSSYSLHFGCGSSFQKNVSNKEHNLKKYMDSSKEKKKVNCWQNKRAWKVLESQWHFVWGQSSWACSETPPRYQHMPGSTSFLWRGNMGICVIEETQLCVHTLACACSQARQHARTLARAHIFSVQLGC